MASDSQASNSQGKPNHLIREKSPYLQQHAYNPVEWHPWGEEAFQKARRENKPIFLSIGYSTCHWCHVMEKESFSDPKIAAIMNKYFVSIKVDREERPDVDKIYMTAVQAMTGAGGWPLSAWLTPDLKPFFGGTYFPPDSRWGRPGFSQILERTAELWKTQRDKLVSSSNDLTEKIQQYMTVEGRQGPLEPAALESGFKSYQSSYQASRGGFGGAPKFPMPVNHNFLLRYWARAKDSKALDMSLHTLREMAKGGIYDHLGGGFHRYSTDDKWHIPHFEKMLYDNAQLAVNYLEAYQISREEGFAQVVRETLEYVLRDMTHPQGGFYSAEDADSLPPELAGKVSDKGHEHKSEGAFYIWEKEEILRIAGQEAGEIFSYRYGIEPTGNAESDPQGEFKNKNILYIAHGMPDTAKKFQKSEKETQRILQETKQKLFEARAKRPRPHLDDKVLVSWNGLMISAFAKAAQILGEPRYAKAAERSAAFIQTSLYDLKTKRLYRRWREGESKVPGIADDYAFLVQGLLDLYEATFDARWLEWAIELTETQNKLFYDSQNGGFYMTAIGHDKNLLVRTKEDSDNVEPSASSIAALNLLRLAQFTDRKDFREAAEKTLTLFAQQLKQQPRSLPQMLAALDFYLSKPKQIVIAGEPSDQDMKEMLEEIHRRFMPNKILLVVNGGKNRETLIQWLPFLKGIVPIGGKATAYVCIDYACELPTNDLKILGLILDGSRPSQGR
ncbi:MAG: thioredoxin domain-containing protein [Elusimicrobia bacterium]|nr:thioredoxin domain-containing protein [Elusimicrobiota bacterium]